ncbi:MAG: DUF5668 domain-containing protein [Massilia sp.]
MSKQASYYWRRQLMWGLLLVGFGTAFLLDRLGLFDIDELWHYWPLLLVVVGINEMIGYPTSRQFAGGFATTCVGLWLFACYEGVFGLSFSNSWPFLLIAWGLKLVIEPLVRARFAENKESDHEK